MTNTKKIIAELLEVLELINVDKDGDGFICREAMPEITAVIRKASKTYKALSSREKAEHNDNEIWVLVIDHKYGTDISVYKSEEEARNALCGYCAEWWDEGLDKQYGKLDDLTRNDIIEAYFDAHREIFYPEWYILDKQFKKA